MKILDHLEEWLITFLMLSLGAPFWFDVVGRLAALRGSGTQPKPAERTVDSSRDLSPTR